LPVSLPIETFFKEGQKSVMIDVRTPAEYNQGHIPGAINIPIFTNEERAEIGTLYKQTGRQEAIHRGLEIYGPRMIWYIEELKKAVADSDIGENDGESNTTNEPKSIYVHCWRGGMRSGAMAWLFEVYGYKVFTLQKGYKTFRRYVLDEFEKPRKIAILGGKTGSGKTFVLNEMKKNIQAIDLEQLAHHKGSSFGSIGELPQPTQEQFENNLAVELMKTDSEKFLVLEDESRKIGHRILSQTLYDQMRDALIFYCEIPFEERAKHITGHYGKYPKEELRAATERIIKRLDGRYAKQALDYIEEGNLIESFKISLKYYDKTYSYGLEQRDSSKIINIPFEKVDIPEIAKTVLKKIKETENNERD
jgi:tRNA 2-selenouridine synthase